MSPSTSKRTASQRTKGLKQSVLGFSTSKRIATPTNAKSKKTTVSRTVSAPARQSSVHDSASRETTPCEDTDEIESVTSSSDDFDEEMIEDEEEEEEVPVAPKRRLRSHDAGAVKKESQQIVNTKGMFRNRNSLDTAKSVVKKSIPADLADKDGKWRKHYGAVRGKMGYLLPIHAETETKLHHILRVFDLSYEYGPCAGVSRLDRWERAKAIGLNPPKEVYDILTTQSASENTEYSQCVFYHYEV